MNSFPPQQNEARQTSWKKKKICSCAAHTVLPTILFINVKYCRSLAPKRLSDPQLPQREETRDREVKREKVGKNTAEEQNRTKSELKYKEGKNKETERKLSNRREEGGDATQGNILYKKGEWW